MKILVVEDEPHIAFNIDYHLRAEGYEVVLATTGQMAMQLYRKAGPFALLIVDIMIPDMDGLEVTRTIRSTDKRTGILLLTAMSGEDHVVTGLAAGADDYVTKPFSITELLLRVGRMVERAKLLSVNGEAGSHEGFLAAGIELNMNTLMVTSNQGTHQLTLLEAKLLAEFMQHPDRVLKREELLRRVWCIEGQVETRTVDNFISRLRRCIERDPAKPQRLISVRGLGYRFVGGVG